jgi:hypothetical protein
MQSETENKKYDTFVAMKTHTLYIKIIFTIFILTSVSYLGAQADSLTETVPIHREVRWFWFAIAGLLAAFITSKIVNKRKSKKD